MPQFQGVLRSTVLLAAGQIASYGLSFLRNIILARVLTKTDFGLAALFSMTISLLELAGRMSFGQQIIQSKHGDSKSFQASSHAFQAVLALTGAFLTLALSYPIARIMNVPQYMWAFATLAVIPFARAFEHQDYFRQQRELRYLPAVLCDFIPQLFVTVAAWPLAIWLGDFRVILWVMIGRAGLGVLMSHLVARHPYHWNWNRSHINKMWIFGLPLFANGLLIFGSQQADQMVVGAFLNLEELAAYALVFSLVNIPGSIFAQVSTSIMLPILSRTQDDPVRFRQQYIICAEYAGIAAVILMLPLIFAGEQFVRLIYGAKYAGAGIIMAVLGTTAAVRFIRIVPAIAAMAKADTMNQLYSNVWRCLSLPLAVAVASLGGGATLIAACALLAELAAVLISVLRLHRHHNLSLRNTMGAAIYVFSFLSVGVSLGYIGAHHWSYWLIMSGLCTLLALAILIAWIAFPVAAKTLVTEITRKHSSENEPIALI